MKKVKDFLVYCWAIVISLTFMTIWVTFFAGIGAIIQHYLW